MRASIIIAAVSIPVLSSPALSQRYGGGMEGSTAQVNQTQHGTSPSDMVSADPAKNMLNEKAEFDRVFLTLQKKSPVELRAMDSDHRKVAEALAGAARAGAVIPLAAKDRIRIALTEDIAAWRAEFSPPRKEWEDMRNKWLSATDATTARDWVLRRADWFVARDVWVAKQNNSANAQSGR